MIDAPIWWLEARLFDVWEWITGMGRLPMRRVFLVAALLLLALGLIKKPLYLAISVLLWSTRWFNRARYVGTTETGYQDPVARYIASLGIYLDLTVGAIFVPDVECAWAVGWVFLWLSDFVLWANHMNRPRRRRKTLPEWFRELLSTLDWLPKPAPAR